MPTVTRVNPVLEDPLLTRVPLEYEALFYPYGFPARIRSNSARILSAAEASYGTCRQEVDSHPVDLRVLVEPGSGPACAELPVLQSQGNLLSLVADAENFAALDLNGGFGSCWVTRATADETDYFRQHFLDVMISRLLRRN
ncbi:MAG TPA: hypothetical protein VH601_06520 [Bryobacteraceae bacterium]|jgi:hypothetical protein